MERKSSVKRNTKETKISIELNIDGRGKQDISTGIGLFDHMLTLFALHGFFDLSIDAKGDLEVDFHHTVEDIGLVLGDAFNRALGERKGIIRCPFLVYNVPGNSGSGVHFDISLAKEFFRAFTVNGGMNLHINVPYGDNEHHIIESIFKATGRALDQATSTDKRIADVQSTKGKL
jgi:imidazoleglycerol-phosphate dehydratase